MTRNFTAIIEGEDDAFVALRPELDVASQGTAVSEARVNLQEAVELVLETASPAEVQRPSGHQLSNNARDRPHWRMIEASVPVLIASSLGTGTVVVLSSRCLCMMMWLPR